MSLRSVVRHLFHPQRSNNHRPRILHPEAYILFSVLAVVFALIITFVPKVSHKAGNVLGFSSTITPTEVITATNQERDKLHLRPLKISQVLSEAAQAKGAHMFAHQYWSHTAPDGTQPWAFFKQFKYDYSIAGENLARDFSDTEDMMQAWMNSPTHKDNIVNSKYQEIGIAVINGKLNGVETTLVVQFFGTPMEGVAQVLPEAATSPGPTTKQARQGAGQADFNLDVLSFAERLPTQVQAAVPNVLSSASFRVSNFKTPPLFSPLQLTKAFFLAILFMVVSTLVYDMVIMHHLKTVRMVGRNAAHIAFFLFIGFLVVFFRSGVIG